jgi:predicted amidohydrolase YtcJ
MAFYNRLGVTTVYEGHAMGHAEIGAYGMLREQDALTVRVLTALEAEPYGLPWTHPLAMAEFRERLDAALAMERTDDDLLRHRGVTLSRGGPCWPGFLRMWEPYRDPWGEPTTGVEFVEPEKEQVALDFCADRDLRLNFIGAGYRDHDEFLDRAEAVARRVPVADRAWILQHVFFLTERNARRYAALGIRATTSMSFSWGKGDLFVERIGEHVLGDLIPLRRMLDAGLIVGCGTDWGPKNVFEHVALAETHEFAGSGRRNDGPAQRVTRAEALRMWTADAARAIGWAGVGTLAPGSHADLIVVDRDPPACPTAELAGACAGQSSVAVVWTTLVDSDPERRRRLDSTATADSAQPDGDARPARRRGLQTRRLERVDRPASWSAAAASTTSRALDFAQRHDLVVAVRAAALRRSRRATAGS